MKSAYELAMERLDKTEPKFEITEEMRAQLADVDQRFQAKIAEREVFLGGLLEKAKAEGNFEEVMQLDEQKTREIAKLRVQWEEGKEQVRKAGG